MAASGLRWWANGWGNHNMSLSAHQAKYLAYELTRRGPADSIEKFAGTLADAKVDMNPHQVEAALFACKSPLSQGAILEDEVGLGKTIEAGIVLSQFWAEGKNRILLLVPASLRKQWQNELADKFYLPSTILEGPSFNKCLKAGISNPFDRRSAGIPEIVICSQPFAAGKDDFLLRTPWDLVVIDEALAHPAAHGRFIRGRRSRDQQAPEKHLRIRGIAGRRGYFHFGNNHSPRCHRRENPDPEDPRISNERAKVLYAALLTL